MSKIISHIKKHKVKYTKTAVVVAVAALLALGHYMCPEQRFKRACKDEKTCAYLDQRLTKSEKKAFLAIHKYQEETGKNAVDNGVLKYTDKRDVVEVLIKVDAAAADVARQTMLDNLPPEDKFKGDYNCIRRVMWNELSNTDVLVIQFSQSPQAQNVNILKHPTLRPLYIGASSKIMKCMNPEIQQAYLAEIQASAEPEKEAPKKGTEKPKTPAKKK